MRHSEDRRELEIVGLVQRGDRAAMKELYCSSAAHLMAVCSRYVIDDECAKDILHDSFLKIFASISRFQYRGMGSLRQWMARIVVNESLKHLQSIRNGDFIDIENIAEADIAEEEPDVSQLATTEIFSMIRQLPQGYRQVFNLFVLDGYSHREIASMLGISPSTSASQLHHAKSLLAKMIRNHNER